MHSVPAQHSESAEQPWFAGTQPQYPDAHEAPPQHSLEREHTTPSGAQHAPAPLPVPH